MLTCSPHSGSLLFYLTPTERTTQASQQALTSLLFTYAFPPSMKSLTFCQPLLWEGLTPFSFYCSQTDHRWLTTACFFVYPRAMSPLALIPSLWTVPSISPPCSSNQNVPSGAYAQLQSSFSTRAQFLSISHARQFARSSIFSCFPLPDNEDETLYLPVAKHFTTSSFTLI